MKILQIIVLSLLSGSLYALAYPSFLFDGHIFFLFIGLIPFFWLLQKNESYKIKTFIILSFNTGLNIAGFYWIPHTLQEFGQLPFSVSLLLSLFFSLILQPHWWGYLLWEKLKPKIMWKKETNILLTSVILTILERFIPQQFPIFVGSPWLHLSPYLGLTPFLGSVVFSFFTYWICLELISQVQLHKIRLQVWICSIIFVLFNVFIPLEKNKQNLNQIHIRLVQANIGNFMKVSSEYGDENSYEAVRKKYLELSTKNKSFKPDLIIWPETAYPDSFYGEKTRLNPLFTKIMNETGAELLIGGYDQDPNKPQDEIIESVFNSSILLSNSKLKSSYHKNILIPFGETLPFGPLNSVIVNIVPAISLFAKGEGTPLMETKKGLRFITPICYEILETNFMRNLLNQFGNNHFIVNHTNDSWYGNTAEPFQHLFLSKWRALEFSLPIIRSTNTGITSVIFEDGSESERLILGEENYLDLKLEIGESQNTFYQRFGFLPCLALMMILLLITWTRERKESQP